MARINITGGRTKFWSLCSECKDTGDAWTMPEIVEDAKHHLTTAHAASAKTHRIEMDMDHLVALTNAAHLSGEADAEGN